MERPNIVAAMNGACISTLKPKDCPLSILKLASSRLHAYQAYPNHQDCFRKILIIDKIKHECRSMLNQHPQTISKWVLAIEPQLYCIMPGQTSKLKQAYYDKVQAIVIIAKDFLKLKERGHE